MVKSPCREFGHGSIVQIQEKKTIKEEINFR